MAVAAAIGLDFPPDPVFAEPERRPCWVCFELVLAVVVKGAVVLAEIHEWEPRAACYECATILARGQRRPVCPRCGATRYVGEPRPKERVVAIDMAWADESHIRIIGPRTPRRKGEALHRLHHCA